MGKNKEKQQEVFGNTFGGKAHKWESVAVKTTGTRNQTIWAPVPAPWC